MSELGLFHSSVIQHSLVFIAFVFIESRPSHGAAGEDNDRHVLRFSLQVSIRYRLATVKKTNSIFVNVLRKRFECHRVNGTFNVEQIADHLDYPNSDW
jgi:hypothetical protein